MCSERQCIHHRGRELWALTPRQHANAWVIDEPGQVVTSTPISGVFLATEQSDDVRQARLQFELQEGRLARLRALEPSKKHPFWENVAPRLFSEPRRRVLPHSGAPEWKEYDQNHFRHEVHSRLVQNRIDAQTVIDALDVPTRPRLLAWHRGSYRLNPVELERLRAICGLDPQRLETCARLDRQVYAEDYRSWADEPHRPFLCIMGWWYLSPVMPVGALAWAVDCAQAAWLPVDFFPHRGHRQRLDHDGTIIESHNILPDD